MKDYDVLCRKSNYRVYKFKERGVSLIGEISMNILGFDVPMTIVFGFLITISILLKVPKKSRRRR